MARHRLTASHAAAITPSLHRKELAALDAAAEGDPDAVTLDFSVLWAPHDLLDGETPSE